MTWSKIDEKIKAGSYINNYNNGYRPRRRDSYHITDSTKSVDWNKKCAFDYNDNEYPRLEAEWLAEEMRMKEIFKTDITVAFLQTSPDITEIRAAKMYEIANEYGSKNYIELFNKDSRQSPNLFEEILMVAEELADIFNE